MNSRYHPAVFVALVAVAHAALAQQDDTADMDSDIAQRTQLTLDDLRTFTEVFARVQRDYIEEVGDRELLENAIRGMLRDLDPHTRFLDREQFAALEEETSGQYGGIGVEVLWISGGMSVREVTEGGPAHDVGIRAGDVISLIDGEDVATMPAADAMAMVRGPVGTSVTLTLTGERFGQPWEVVVDRAAIAVPSVAAELFDNAYAHIAVESFQADTAEEVSAALSEMTREAGQPLAGLILDLRGNPGGVLSAAVGLADLFLSDGLIVYTRARTPEAELSFSAGPVDEMSGAPIVVVVDAGSASASEVVAGALQDHGRALVLGQRTFGKGSVQSVMPLGNGGAVKLTTSRYYTPSGRSIQAHGIVPDVDLTGDSHRPDQDGGRRREIDLDGHLQGLDGYADASDTGSIVREDYALHRALSLLKAHRILGRLDQP